jgi:NADH-quinone oxidoreductase subunit J
LEPARVGATLLGPYLLAMELASMLLLAGLVGAWHLGRPTECGEPGPRPSAPKEASAT